MLTCAIRDEKSGEIVGVLVLSPKTFSSGKTGFFGVAKIEIGGQRYQAQAQAVAIAPKGDGDETAQAGE
jgi:hypothetical protein